MDRAGAFLAAGRVAVEIAVLAVTGVALFFLYRPSASAAWADLDTDGLGWSVRMAMALRLLHRLASGLALLTAVTVGTLVALRAVGRRWVGPALGVGIAVTTLLGSATGHLLPWDQLALRAVTVGTNYRGYVPLFDPVVRLVLLNGTEVTPSTVLWWLFVHVLVLGPLLAGLVVLGWRRRGP